METALTKPQPQPLTNTSNLALTTDEKYFYQLETVYTIKQYEELKLKDAGSGHEGARLARYHIGNALHIVYQMVGLKKENWPTGDLAKRISHYIQKTFPYIAPSELITAVEFGLQGKFPTLNKEQKSIFEHYQVMDLTWVNDLLQAYVKFRYDKKTILSHKLEQSKLSEIDQIYENLQKDDEAVKALIIDAFNRYKANNADRVTWLRDAWFDWLVYIGFMKYDKEKLNQRFKELRRNRLDLTHKQCMHEARVDAIYDKFETLIYDEQRFTIFETTTYINGHLLACVWEYHARQRKK